MSGLLHGGPLIVLREDRGGPPKARVDRVLRYLRRRDARSARQWEREKRLQEREAAKPSPCVYCGVQTDPWERNAGVPICMSHCGSMSGRFPFRLGVLPAGLEKPVEEALFAARKALYVFERLVRQEEAHGRQVR